MHAMLQGCDEAESNCAPASIGSKSDFVTRLWQEAEDISTSDEHGISAATLSKVFHPMAVPMVDLQNALHRSIALFMFLARLVYVCTHSTCTPVSW